MKAACRPPSRRPLCRVSSVGRSALASAVLWLLGSGPGATPLSASIGGSVTVPEPPPSVLLAPDLLRTPSVDAVPLCVPSPIGNSLGARATLAAKRPGGARELADSLELDASEASPATEQVIALLRARAVESADDARRALAGLGPWRSRERGPESQACARLESARLELRLRRLPEAVAHARIAGELSGRVSEGVELQRAADFYAAEGLYLAGREQQARAIYRKLSVATSSRIAAAARLRFADSLFDSGQREGAKLEYEDLLGRAEEFGASLRGWGLRALEASLEQGDLESARRWAEAVLAADPEARVRGAARIRVADLLMASGQREAALHSLQTLVESDEAAVVRAIARLRIAHLSPAAGDPEQMEELRSLASEPWRPVADYARLLLARDLLAAGDPAGALDPLSRVAIGPMADQMAGPLKRTLDQALQEMARTATSVEVCADYVATVGWRRRLLARRAGALEPFAGLGACYAMLGLEQVAIEVFRDVVRRFGPEGEARVALPLARASLSRGDVEYARRAAIEHVRDGDEGDSHWRLLLAEMEMFEGRYGQAVETLEELVRSDRPRGERARAIVLLARAASHLSRLVEVRFVLGDALERLQASGRSIRSDWLGEAALLTAEGHRSAGNLLGARDFYRMAMRQLPAGERRDQAAYWLGELEEQGAPAASGNDAALRSGAWRRLAETRRDIRALRRRIAGPSRGDEAP